MNEKIFQILSVEDNAADFTLLQTAFKKIPDIQVNIVNINNGAKALDYLFKRKEFKSSETPELIILDINLPQISGHEILKIVRRSRKYKKIPIIMFSTSSQEEDITKAYESYANSYIIKSFNVKVLFDRIAVMGEYWLKTSIMPSLSNLYIIKKEENFPEEECL